MTRRLLIGAINTICLMVAAPASPQQSHCAECHYADPAAPRRDHWNEWERSPHGRNRVGCESCHGGNAQEFEDFLAHRGVLSSSDKASPVNRKNLPFTCGQCHIGPLVAFEDSRHYELLRSGSTGSNNGPTCSTCHGAVDGRVLSPKALASQCGDCHGPGEVAPRAERVRLVREQYEGLTVVREQVKRARSLIKRVDDKERRAELTKALDRVQGPLTRAVDAGHKFVYEDLKQYLAIAEERVQVVLATFANR
jgi:hypothetical protein